MEDYFTITTNRDTAEKIEKQCIWDEKFKSGRSIVLGKIVHDDRFSVVQIKAREGAKIKPEDIFWLGLFSATR